MIEFSRIQRSPFGDVMTAVGDHGTGDRETVAISPAWLIRFTSPAP